MDGITVCTTFPTGMDLYGQRFIDSFAEKVDKRINLLNHAEDCNPNNRCNPNNLINAKDALPKIKF